LQNAQEEEAFENYGRAIEIDPGNEDIYCNRAQVYAMKGMFDQCFADFDKCLELNRDHKVAKIQRAFFEFRQFFAQFSMYMQATQQASGSGGMRSLYENSRELQVETKKLEQLINEHSDIPEAYNLYAQILSEQENYEKAESYYKLALSKDSKNAALMVQQALNIMTWRNDFEEPVKMLNEAIRVDETCEFAYETLATIEIQRGKLTEAIELFEKAIQLTRSEDSMTNLCCMLIGARTQNKILAELSSNPNMDFRNY
jgi:import receptor subunit TOM70